MCELFLYVTKIRYVLDDIKGFLCALTTNKALAEVCLVFQYMS